MAAPNAVFSQLVTAQHRWQGKTITEQFVAHNALWRTMKKRGNVRTNVDGGREITFPIAYDSNKTIMNYDGFQRHNLGQTDFLTDVKYDWRNKAAYVIASGPELRMNKGKSKLIDLAEAKRKNLVDSIANHMAIEVYQDGSTAGAIGGLKSIITADGTGTVGGIDASSYTWWANKYEGEPTAAGTWLTDATALRRAMNKLYIKTTIGTKKPDLCVLTNDLYESYLATLQNQQRYMSNDKARAGFDNLMFIDNMEVIFDLNASGGFQTETGYMLNTEFLYLIEHEDAKWAPEAERKPLDQDGIAIPYYWMGQMVCTSRRHQGTLVVHA